MRAKRKVGESITASQMEKTFGDYAKVTAQLKETQSRLEQRITRLREEAGPRLEVLRQEEKALFTTLQLWAEQNQNRFLGTSPLTTSRGKKSVETLHGLLGFRTSTPKLKPLKGYRLKDVLALVQEFLPQFIRSKSELDKEQIITKRGEIPPETQTQCGFEIVQDETFFVEVKVEEVET